MNKATSGKNTMKIFRIIVLIISAGILVAELFLIDYMSFFSRHNLGSFLVIIAMIFNIIAMFITNRTEPGKKH